MDERAEDVLSLEEELTDLPGASADIDEKKATGQVTEVDRLDADQVPDAYPVRIDTNEAIAFRVTIDANRESTVYLPWPDKYDSSAALARLLNELDISPDRFADILAEKIPLRVIEGQWVPEVPGLVSDLEPSGPVDPNVMPNPPERHAHSGGPEVVMNDGTVAVIEDQHGTRVVDADRVDQLRRSRPRRSQSRQPSHTQQPHPNQARFSDKWHYGVIGFSLIWVDILLWLNLDVNLIPSPLLALFALISPFVFPFVVYADTKYVTANSDWSPSTIVWSLGVVLWFINLIVAVIYLLKRNRSTFRE